jgi:hypothetical protein
MQTLWWGFEVTAHFDLLCFTIVHSGLFSHAHQFQFPCICIFATGNVWNVHTWKATRLFYTYAPKVSQAQIPNLMPWNCLHRALYYNLILTLPKYIWRPLHTQIVFFNLPLKHLLHTAFRFLLTDWLRWESSKLSLLESKDKSNFCCSCKNSHNTLFHMYMP